MPTTNTESAPKTAHRRSCSRSSHGHWKPHAERRDPLAILREQERHRLPELLPLRHERMSASPFAFFRGAAAIMADDLSRTPNSGITVQLCGDAHLSNFGAYAAPDRRSVFDVNDFDETLPGPWEWDLKRLATSFVIAGRHRKFSEKKRRALVECSVGTYRSAMRSMAAMDTLDVWYLRVDVEDTVRALTKEFPHLDHPDESPAKTNLRALRKLTEKVGDSYRFKDSPPLLVPGRSLPPLPDGTPLRERLDQVITCYRDTLIADRRHLLDQFTTVDIARKVVGVGSVGTRAWVVMLQGHSPKDALFLQVKEAQASVLEPYQGHSRYANQGERVVQGQRLMQTSTDILLGWCTVPNRDGDPIDYYVRQLWDSKRSVDVDHMTYKGMKIYAQLCGATLARAHARSADRTAIAAYLGRSDTFDRAVAHFAEAYADQNETDHAALVDSINNGTMVAGG